MRTRSVTVMTCFCGTATNVAIEMILVEIIDKRRGLLTLFDDFEFKLEVNHARSRRFNNPDGEETADLSVLSSRIKNQRMKPAHR